MIFIPLNVPSSKNSKTAVPGKGVFHSATVKSYLQKHGIQAYSVTKRTVKGYKARPNAFYAITHVLKEQFDSTPKPFVLGFHFVRDSRRKYDFHNAVQIIFDLLVAHNVLSDDDTSVVYGVPFKINDKWESLDPKNPGVYLTILNESHYGNLRSEN